MVEFDHVGTNPNGSPIITGLTPGTWTKVDPPQRIVNLTSSDAPYLVATGPANPHVLGCIGQKLYISGPPATERERLALLKPGRRACSW